MVPVHWVVGRWSNIAEKAGVGLSASEGRTAKDAIDGLLELSRSEESRARQLACRNLCTCHVRADDRWKLADQYASEHVEVLTENPREALAAMHNYGALFLGEGTCVSYGDKIIGTNHVLPTRGAANYTGGLWVDKYLQTVTYQEVTDPAASARLGELCGRAARVEFFEGHARSGDVRARKYMGAPLPWAPTGT